MVSADFKPARDVDSPVQRGDLRREPVHHVVGDGDEAAGGGDGRAAAGAVPDGLFVWPPNVKFGKIAPIFFCSNFGTKKPSAQDLHLGFICADLYVWAGDEMDGRADLFNLFVAAAVHALQFSARSFASGRRAGLGRRRRRVVSFLRASVLERQPTQMKDASCFAENSIC